MRYLLGLNWLLLAASSTLALVLSVVLLIYWVYRDEPIIQASFDSLLQQTGMFVGYMLVCTLATWALRKRWPAFWALQILLFVGLAGIVEFYLPDS